MKINQINPNNITNDYIKNNIQKLKEEKEERIVITKENAVNSALTDIHSFFIETPILTEKCIILVDTNYIHHVKEALIAKGFDIDYNTSLAKPIDGDYQNLLQTSLIVKIK
jgi:hypothetical protein